MLIVYQIIIIIVNYFDIAQFVKACLLLSKNIKNDSLIEETVKDIDENIKSKLILTEDNIKKYLEINKIILPFKSPKIKLW